MFAGCASNGGGPLGHTVIVKDLLSLPGQAPPTVAVTDAAKVPDVVVGEGARWIFPVRVAPDCGLSVLVMNVGPLDVNVIAEPSGSVAVNV